MFCQQWCWICWWTTESLLNWRYYDSVFSQRWDFFHLHYRKERCSFDCKHFLLVWWKNIWTHYLEKYISDTFGWRVESWDWSLVFIFVILTCSSLGEFRFWRFVPYQYTGDPVRTLFKQKIKVTTHQRICWKLHSAYLSTLVLKFGVILCVFNVRARAFFH